MQYVISLFLAAFLFFSAQISATAEATAQRTEEQSNSIQEYVVRWASSHLPQTGTLMEDKRGFVYLKVDDNYINQLFPMLPHSGYSKPAYFRRPDAPGAHISVFYIDERNQTGEIKEIGKQYSFKVVGIAAVPPKTSKYIVLEVESPELESLRKKYGLSPLLKGHDFHITVAKKNRRHH